MRARLPWDPCVNRPWVKCGLWPGTQAPPASPCPACPPPACTARLRCRRGPLVACPSPAPSSSRDPSPRIPPLVPPRSGGSFARWHPDPGPCPCPPLCRAAVPPGGQGLRRAGGLRPAPASPAWKQGPAAARPLRPPCSPAMAPLLALVLVALVGLPLGEMGEAGGMDRPRLWVGGRADSGRGRNSHDRRSFRSSALRKEMGPGVRWVSGQASPCPVTPAPPSPLPDAQPRPWTATCAPTTGRTASTPCAARPWSATA